LRNARGEGEPNTWAPNGSIVSLTGNPGNGSLTLLLENIATDFNTNLTSTGGTGIHLFYKDPAVGDGVYPQVTAISCEFGGMEGKFMGGTYTDFADGVMVMPSVPAQTAFFSLGRNYLGIPQNNRMESLMIGRQTSVLPIACILTGSKTWDPPSIPVGEQAVTTVTVPGAKAGDWAMVCLGGYGGASGQLFYTAVVSAADTVTVTIWNYYTAAVDIASTTVKVVVIR
jgi:hypothetical protein